MSESKNPASKSRGKRESNEQKQLLIDLLEQNVDVANERCVLS